MLQSGVSGRLTAWQCFLSRAGLLSRKEFEAWQRETWKMLAQDLFHGDLWMMHAAFSVVAREPRIGLTLFAPGNTVQQLPLMANLEELVQLVAKVGILGPGGLPSGAKAKGK